MARIEQLTIAADAEPWAAAGFAVEDGWTRVGSTPLRFLAGEGGRDGIAGWTLSGTGSGVLDGLPTALSEQRAPDPPPEHPIGALALDHLVAFTPALERTIAAFERAGVECRRVREVGPPDRPLRQAFFRFGEVICEVVEVPVEQAGPGGAARFWGLTVTVADLAFAVEQFGDRCGAVREAVQPGRRIATVHESAGLGLPVALISPPARREAGTG